MIITLGNERNTNSSLFFNCEGCPKILIVKVDWYSGYCHNDARDAAIKHGWRRRKFTDVVYPWFCSDECANNSDNAKYWSWIHGEAHEG